MQGIVLIDDDVQREILASSQHRSSQERPYVVRQLRPEYALGHGLPRTDFTTPQPRVPRTDFTTHQPARSADIINSARGVSFLSHQLSDSDKRGLGDTQRTSLTMAMSADNLARGTEVEAAHSDIVPMLYRHQSRGSSTDLQTAQDGGGGYAGTSSGLKLSVGWNMVGLFVGIVLGAILSEVKLSLVAARWLSLPGDLFLRALKCLVVPYVFCSVAVAVGDIVFVGKISIIGVQTAKIYVTFWVSTASLGVAVAMLFRPFFHRLASPSDLALASVGFTCPDHLLLTQALNGSVACSTNATALANATTFVIKDLNDVLAKNTRETIAKLTLSDQIMQTITPMVSSNLFKSLATAELIGIITFSMLLGSIAGRSYFTKTRRVNYVYLSLLQLRNAFFLLMEWTIWLSPLAIVSIVAGSFASNPNVLGTFGDVYPYLLAAVSAALIQMLVLYPVIVFLLTRTNPYAHMKQMLRAYMFAFACASSLGTMPVTLSCIKNARMCSQSLANFVISIGVVLSTSGVGFYLPIALVFIAESSGNGDQLTPFRVVGIFALSLLTCAGTPPIPAAGLVVISTAYTTLFGPVPATTFAYVAAMDVFFDRFVTVCNVNDDLMALKIISETTDETVAQDQLGERF